ncbi:MAG: DUF4832 domain-containing protein [Clostridia bacterium]|nr:DUF4832 domain-containing protein [Clostridia bacterium]
MKKNIRKILAGVLTAVVALGVLPVTVGCGDKTEQAAITTVAPAKLSGKLDNPGMGWSITEDGTFMGVLDNGETGDYNEIDAINYTSTWALMEPEEGKYDFTLLDEAIAKWGNKLGKVIHLRISTDSFMLPSTYTGAPYWLAEKYNIPTQYFQYTSASPVKQAVAYDITNENYLAALTKFLTALAEHIKGVECIGDIDLRGYGLWGEWHTGYMFGTTDEKREALTAMIDLWVETFAENGNLLVLSASWDPNYIDNYGAVSGNAYQDYYSWAALDYAYTFENMTIRRDGAGGALLEQDKRLMAEAFHSGKEAYLHAEFNAGAESYTDTSSINSMTAVNDMLYNTRTNYSTILGWTARTLNMLIEEGRTGWLDRGFEKIGYRLAVDLAEYPSTVSAGASFDLFSRWSNSGVGRFPYDYGMTVYLLDESGKVAYEQTFDDFVARKFILGDVNDHYATVKLPAALSGKYTLAVALTDEVGTPAIELGMSGQIDKTRMYALGSINVKGKGEDTALDVVKTDYKGLQAYEFEANTSYAVTFRYKPEISISDYVLGSTSSFVFRVANGSNVLVNERWKDVSTREGTKTVVFTTGNEGGCKASILSDHFGNIEIGDCFIKKQTLVMAESFSKKTNLTDFTASFTTSASQNSKVLTAADKDSGTLISGDASVRLWNRGGGFNYGLYQNNTKFTLDANSVYTVNFLQSCTSVSMGSYFLVGLYYADTNEYKVVGEWYDPDENGITQKTYTFATDGRGGQLVFGMFNAGEYVVDDISLVKHEGAAISEEEEGYFPRNEVPVFNFGIGKTEDFESGALSATGFDLGTFNMFRMTKDPELVISGDYSALIQVEPANYESLYFELMWSQAKYYKFEANTTYQISMKFKDVYRPDSAKAYMIFRDRNHPGDDRYNIYAYFTGGNAAENHGNVVVKDYGSYKEFVWTVTLKDSSNYEFGICYYNDQIVVIDDILVTKA